MATTSTNFISALGGGSGIDIKALAQNLVDAEKAPKAAIIQKSIDKSQARISGYATVAYAVSQVQSALDALKNVADFNSFSVNSSKPNTVTATVTGTPVAGTHEVKVTQLAQAQRSVSSGFSAGQSLNGGSPFTLNLTIGGAVKTVTVSDATPEGVVSAVNAAGLDVTATLLNTGVGATPLNVILTGKPGASNSFTVSSTSTDSLGFPADPTSAAQASSPNRQALDAVFEVDGLTVNRSSNKVSDVIDGVTLDLYAASNTDTSVVTLSRNTAPVKEKIKAIVNNYNDLQSILDAALDKDSTVEKLGGTLVGDSTIRGLRDQVRRILLPDSASPDSSSGLNNLRQLGMFIDTDGKMKFATLKQSAAVGESLLNVGDEGRLDQALSSRFDEVVNLFAGTSGGIGIAKKMSDQLSGSGVYIDSTASPSSPKKLLSALQQNALQRVSLDKQRLTDLESRMTQLLDRYTRQFSVMESLVGESKSTRTGVENSFKGMSNSR